MANRLSSPTQAPTGVYTSGEYLALNPTWHVEDSSWKASHIMAILQANRLAPKSICDVGCGVGEVIRCMAATLQDSKFVGYDISALAIERAQRRKTANVVYKEGDVFAFGVHYDLAMAIDVLEHVDDYIGFARKLKQLATFKIYHIPLDMSVQAVLREEKLPTWRKELGHLHYFDKDTALATLKYAQHEIVDYRYTSGAVELGSKSILQRVANIPRRVVFPLAPDLTARVVGGFSLLILCK